MLKKIISLTAIITIFSIQPVFADNTGFTAQQIKALKVLNKPVIIAGWIPKGFKVEKVKISLESHDNPRGISNYKIIYSNYPKVFEIESQNQGLGDEPDSPNLKVRTKFGNLGVFVTPKCISSDWIITKKGSIQFSGCDLDALNRKEEANAILREDAIKIISSLQLMK